jgi:hypothetical protein
MSAISRLRAAAVAVVLVAGLGLTPAAPASATTTGVESGNAIVPFPGHYKAWDRDGRLIKFYLNATRTNVQHFSVDGHLLLSSGAPVAHGKVRLFCIHGTTKCIRGHWVAEVLFQGIWNDGTHGAHGEGVHFQAFFERP